MYSFLSPRLRLAFDRFPDNVSHYIDIGTDHGYLPAALLLAGKIQFATATDINSAPLERARRTAVRFGIEDKVRFVEAAGLAFDFGKPDVITICGMGGLMIADIIDEASLSDDCVLFLQPMTKTEQLRYSLAKMGYSFDESYAVEGDKVFVMIKAKKDSILQKQNADINNIKFIAGFPEPGQEKSKKYAAYLNKIIYRERKTLEGLLRSDNKKAKAAEVVTVLQQLERIHNVI